MATRDELYAKFGITAEAAQLFETSLGTVVLCAKGFNEGWHMTPDGDAATKALQDIDGSTLGRLLGKFRDELRIEPTIADQFSRALKVRNRLFHGFYERHNFKIQTAEGRDDMIADLEEMHEELFRAWRVAEGIAQVLHDAFMSWREANETTN